VKELNMDERTNSLNVKISNKAQRRLEALMVAGSRKKTDEIEKLINEAYLKAHPEEAQAEVTPEEWLERR
jgi:hypothetical protein